MINRTQTHYKRSALYALTATGTIVTLLCASFFLAEPMISYGDEVAPDFRIRQTITDETSFLVYPSNVTMAGSISGVTGGNATGTTDFVVQSNNSTGYYVEIAFENNGTPEAMIGDNDASEALRDYSSDVGGEPSFGFTASTAAQFAYTVTSATIGDTDPSFHNNGAVCNNDTSETAETCWKSPATTAFRIVDRTTSAVTGATSTIQFKVNVPSGALPVPTAQTYTATATLSLFAQ
ncbi:hypothetical protein H6784_02340 [Candidatus Nomurabacteria bacterium]|nr:hypothetical protein [Candidatus Kaiserbacteria bacterium]MCB9814235.1 hypothetical protein [Candidatus Nomurabacteria bacterium]